MKKIYDVFTLTILALSIAIVINIFSTQLVFANDLPKCALVKMGSEKCMCEKNLLFPDKICNKGEACVHVVTTSSYGTAGGSYTSSLYSCISVDKAEDKSYGDYYSSYSSSIQSLEKTMKTFCTNSTTSCAPYCQYTAVTECTLCPIFGVVFNTVSSLGAKAVHAYSSSVIIVVVVAFAIWLAVQILAFASSVETRDLKDLMSSMMTQGFVVMFVVAILYTGVSGFFSTFINPVYNTGQKMAQTMFTERECKVYNDKGEIVSECTEDDKTVTGKDFTSRDIRDIEDGLPASMGNNIIQTMTMMENRVRKFKALGVAMMCQSFKDGFFIIPKPSYLLTGLAIWALCMLMIIGVPFLMIDAVFQLGVAVALLPPAVGSFAFKSTRQYSKKVWETFLNSMFAFVFISVIVLIVLGTIQAGISEGMETVGGSKSGFEDMFTMTGGGATYFEAMISNFGWFSLPFLKLVFIFILAWSVMNTAQNFAGEFADSISETSIGSSIGTMAASSAKGMAVKAGKPLVEAAGKGIKSGTERAIRGIAHSHRRGKYQKDKDKIKEKGTVDQNGKRTFKDKDGTTYTMENDVVIKEKQTEKITRTDQHGRAISKQTTSKKTIRTADVTITQTTVTTWKQENGEWKAVSSVTEEQVKFNSEAMEKVVGKDGSVDTEKMAKLLKGLSGDTRKQVQVVIAKEATKRRISKAAHDYDNAKIVSQEIVSQDPETGEMTIKEVTAKGEVVFTTIKLHSNGSLETSMTKIDANGKMTTFTSDGIRNKMQVSRIEKNVNIQKLKNVQEAYDSREKDKEGNYKSSKVSYGYSKYWQNQIDHGLRPEDIPEGALSGREVYGETALFDKDGKEFGTVGNDGTVYDNNGVEIGKRHRSGKITDKDGNTIYKWNDYKSRKVGGEFGAFVNSEGNEFQKTDMNWYFR